MAIVYDKSVRHNRSTYDKNGEDGEDNCVPQKVVRTNEPLQRRNNADLANSQHLSTEDTSKRLDIIRFWNM